MSRPLLKCESKKLRPVHFRQAKKKKVVVIITHILTLMLFQNLRHKRFWIFFLFIQWKSIINFHYMDKNSWKSLKCLWKKKVSYRFRQTWGQINYIWMKHPFNKKKNPIKTKADSRIRIIKQTKGRRFSPNLALSANNMPLFKKS